MDSDLPELLKRYTTISSVIDTLRNKRLMLLNPQTWDDRNDAAFLELYRGAKQARYIYALCCSRSRQTYHHWRVFTMSYDGCFIEFRLKPLRNSLIGNPRVRMGKVEYYLLDELEAKADLCTDDLPFIKRKGFRHEGEFRIISWSSRGSGRGLAIPFDLAWINRIVFNPWIPDTLYKSVRETLLELPDCSGLKITHSRLTDTSRWKAVGDRLAQAGARVAGP